MENLQGGTIALEHRYNIEQRAGQRPFATAYIGTQEPFARPVWITVFDALRDAGASRLLFERIKTSAHLTSRLDTPGVLRVVDFGELDEGVPFVVSERLPAPSLESLLHQHGTLPLEAVAALVERVAEILTHAHELEVFHGGLNPRTIFLPESDTSRAAVGHFQLGLTLQEIRSLPEVVLTGEMAFPFPPEAFEVADADPSVFGPIGSLSGDVYALGAIAYTALAGVHPYFDDPVDPGEGLVRIQSQPPPSATGLGVEAEVANVLSRALDPEPSRRWSSPRAFADALRAAITAEEPAPEVQPAATLVTAPAPSPEPQEPEAVARRPLHEPAPTPRGTILMLAVAILLLSNLGWFFYSVGRQAPTPTPAEASADAPEILPLGFLLETSPTGAHVYEARDEREVPLGTTPLVLSPLLRDRDAARLIVRHPDFHEQTLEVRQTDAGPDMTITLSPRGEARRNK